MLQTGRLSGILLPLFSLRSRTDFGIGDFGGVDGLFQWMTAAQQRMLMLLPLLPTAPGNPSPYATRSAFGLNPLFIHLDELPEFIEAGGRQSLSDDERRALDEARTAERIRYDLVFPLKTAALRRAFDHFETVHWKPYTSRAKELAAYQAEQAEWLDDYCLFAALSQREQYRAWWEWPEPIRVRDPQALAEEKEKLSREILFHAWLQWITEMQWQQVRAKAKQAGILLCGDEPFIIGQDSSDVWAHPDILRRDARLGVPPDAFSATGQDWGLPYFDFVKMEADGYAWIKFRARKSATYYDLRRVDHAVGYFRQWIRDEKTPTGRFIPPDEASHKALGERIFRILGDSAGIVAEDLGVIPKFVREILTQLGIPGYRVMRWERDEMVYRNPREYPAVSLATTGTHDTETLREWWEGAPQYERDAVAAVFPELKGKAATAQLTPELHELLLASAENAGSDLCIIPWQDVLGTRDRVNLPGSESETNWAYRISQSSEELLQRDETRRAAERMARLTVAGRRGNPQKP